MPRIQHIAIVAEDQAKPAEFYKKAFGMTEVWSHDVGEGGAGQAVYLSDGHVNVEAVYLSDGHVNVAILPARGRPEDLDHFGIQVEDLGEASQSALSAGGIQGPKAVPQDGRLAQVFIKDPVGTRVDLSERGWKLKADEPQQASAG